MDKYELVGLAGSVMVIISFMFKDVKKMRLVNMVGSALFIIYGILIRAWSVVFLDSMLIIVQTIQLIKARKGKNE